MLSFFLIEI